MELGVANGGELFVVIGIFKSSALRKSGYGQESRGDSEKDALHNASLLY